MCILKNWGKGISYKESKTLLMGILFVFRIILGVMRKGKKQIVKIREFGFYGCCICKESHLQG